MTAENEINTTDEVNTIDEIKTSSKKSSTKNSIPNDAEDSDKLSSTLEDYLEIIFNEETVTGFARTGTIAEKANVSSSTVTSALKSLQKMGYVNYQPYQFIKLTPKGKELAEKIVGRHSMLTDFFHNMLQLDLEKANKLACGVEHILDDESFEQLTKFSLFLKNHSIENWQEEYQNSSKNNTSEKTKK